MRAGDAKNKAYATELVNSFSDIQSVHMVPWNSRFYHYFWSWWRKKQGITSSAGTAVCSKVPSPENASLHGPVYTTISGAGDANNKAPAAELGTPFQKFHLWRWYLEMQGPISATISGDCDANYKASAPELVPGFSMDPSLEIFRIHSSIHIIYTAPMLLYHVQAKCTPTSRESPQGTSRK